MEGENDSKVLDGGLPVHPNIHRKQVNHPTKVDEGLTIVPNIHGMVRREVAKIDKDLHLSLLLAARKVGAL